MNKTLCEELPAQMVANPKLMRAYRCIREANEQINDYMECEYREYGKSRGKLISATFNELDGVLPNFWSNLSEMIVADINANIDKENQ